MFLLKLKNIFLGNKRSSFLFLNFSYVLQLQEKFQPHAIIPLPSKDYCDFLLTNVRQAVWRLLRRICDLSAVFFNDIKLVIYCVVL